MLNDTNHALAAGGAGVAHLPMLGRGVPLAEKLRQVRIADKAMGRVLWVPEATAEYQRARSEIKARKPADEAYVGAGGRFVTGRLGTLAGAKLGALGGAAFGAVAGPPGIAVGTVVGGVLGGVAGGVISDKAGVNDAGGEAAKRALRAAKAHREERRHEVARIGREADARMGYGRVVRRPR